ncbi:MAG: hypothetical protein JXA13_10705 [Anaerolineales bacterium]|nr:hypothetical protein [Anaerolineales bacterium]
MAHKTWEVTKTEYCDHVGHEIDIEAEVVYPAEHLPDQPPRIQAHRCSNALECNLIDKSACIYCGTNPNHNPM